ncbi:MAG TPA: NAD-dependent epimerase/dehydratase family protein [Mycobacteriales bacterium]|nr:NAD-dependent epimerase/dehydratase family protein [Mycobacteriales bacterium]
MTGATGFVGAWTAAAVAGAGHELRVLVRTPAKLRTTLGAIGIEPDDVVEGDMTDADAVARALDGVDGVVHSAAVVSMRRDDAAAMTRTNLRGTELVVGGAVERGVPRIVAVSSVAALWNGATDRLTRDSPVGRSAHPYARSKAAVEAYLRTLQDGGAPLATTLPAGVLGPPAGLAASEALEGVVRALAKRALPCPHVRFTSVDVRDLAQVHLALLDPAAPSGRYLVGGHQFRVRDLAADLTAVTGHRVVAIPLPGGVMRAVGRVLDHTPLHTVLTAEGMVAYTMQREVDDSAVARELGVRWRDRRTTLADGLRGMVAAGLVPAALAGRATEGAA